MEIQGAWNGEFKGAAADSLLETLARYLTTARNTSGHANCSVIVNSSGTGKSRVVDELSKRVITVPMCLRGDGSEGSPLPFPFDSSCRDHVYPHIRQDSLLPTAIFASGCFQYNGTSLPSNESSMGLSTLS